MKIVMIIETWEPIWGGGQAHVLELSKKLAQNHGCFIDIYTMNIIGAHGGKQKPVEEFNNGNVRIFRTGKLRNFYSYADRLLWIPEVIRAIWKSHVQEKYHLIHAHANLPGIPGKILSIMLDIPVIYTVHGSNLLDLNKKSIFFYIEKFLFTRLRYNLQITVSRNFLKYPNKNQVIYIPNGVDTQKFDNVYATNIHEKDPRKFKILFVGRFDTVKAVNLLIQAVSTLRPLLVHKHVELCLVGYGYEETQLKQLVENLKLNDLIVFKRLFRDDVIKEYTTADLFILPSLTEGFPLTLLEAWAAKLPVITTTVGEIPNLVQNMVNGILIPPGDVEAIANALQSALTLDETTRKQMGIAGYQTIKESYTWEINAQSTYALYSKLF